MRKLLEIYVHSYILVNEDAVVIASWDLFHIYIYVLTSVLFTTLTHKFCFCILFWTNLMRTMYIRVTIFISVQCSKGKSTLLPLNKSRFISSDVTKCLITPHCPIYIAVISGVRL